MRERWAGPIVVVLILGGVIALLALNLNVKGPNPAGGTSPVPAPSKSHSVGAVRQPAGFREYPIGEEVQKNEMVISAVWLPPVQMEGMELPMSGNMIHLEADIHATEGNRNGFAKDEFIPYLAVRYTIVRVSDKDHSQAVAPIHDKMIPMVARDGLHYGATIEMPGDGHYKLTYAIEPPSAPSAGGLGRHVDAATGVAPWWKPFEVSFDWDYHRAAESP